MPGEQCQHPENNMSKLSAFRGRGLFRHLHSLRASFHRPCTCQADRVTATHEPVQFISLNFFFSYFTFAPWKTLMEEFAFYNRGHSRSTSQRSRRLPTILEHLYIGNTSSKRLCICQGISKSCVLRTSCPQYSSPRLICPTIFSHTCGSLRILIRIKPQCRCTKPHRDIINRPIHVQPNK